MGNVRLTLLPVDGQECVDESAMRALIRHCLKGGADALFTGGTSGMGKVDGGRTGLWGVLRHVSGRHPNES